MQCVLLFPVPVSIFSCFTQSTGDIPCHKACEIQVVVFFLSAFVIIHESESSQKSIKTGNKSSMKFSMCPSHGASDSNSEWLAFIFFNMMLYGTFSSSCVQLNLDVQQTTVQKRCSTLHKY